jgi:membrane fusion protein, multidrug efflux system
MARRMAFLATFWALATVCAPACPAASFEGFTEPYRKIDVAAPETGTVAKLMVREGDRVVRGQSLAVLDEEVLEVSREIADASSRAKGKLDAGQAERDLRKTRLERLQPLRAQGHASQEEIDHARAELAVAEANLLSAREQRRLDELERKKIEAMIERRIVRSPIDGVVTKLHKDEREFVSSLSAAVATVVQLDPLRVTFTLPTP